MKKLLSITLLFFVTLSFSQRWSAYGIKVASENEETVLKLMDDYFTNNKVEGVTVNLYSIMFTAADLNFTHEVIFEGDKESMSKLYTPDFQDTAWQLFSSKISNFVDENVFSANGYRAFEFGELMPFQLVLTFKGDNENVNKWRSMTRKLNEKYPRDFRSFASGGINVGGPSNEANNWMVTGWKSYADYLNNWQSNQNFNKENPKYVKEREKMNDEIDYSNVEPVKKFMRVLVKQW
jgi:hypothetical protein